MHSTRFQRLHQRFGAALTPSRIAFLAVLLYLISLIPIFLFSSYCHPVADDFTYGLLVHRAVVSGDVVRSGEDHHGLRTTTISLGRGRFQQFFCLHYSRGLFQSLPIFSPHSS